MTDFEFGEIKPTLVVRFGRILFSMESMEGSSMPGGTLKQLCKSFYTNIPPSYMEHITSNVVPKIGFKFVEKKLYHVKVTFRMMLYQSKHAQENMSMLEEKE